MNPFFTLGLCSKGVYGSRTTELRAWKMVLTGASRPGEPVQCGVAAGFPRGET